MSCHYFLFKESSDWENSPASIVAVSFGGSGLVTDVREVELPLLMDRIQMHSGGPVPIGEKGLRLGSSTLECYLANDRKDEGAAWPGDADLVLVDSNSTPHTIIEFKKHTPSSSKPFADQKLANYYQRGDNWSPDGRKYNRLAMLRDYLSGNAPLPIIVVYFPTPTSIDQVQLERVEGADRSLRTAESEFVPLPKASDAQSCRDFVASLLEMDKIMRFKFEANQDYQLRAIESVANLLEGQPHIQVELSFAKGSLFAAVRNRMDLDDESLLKNLRLVQAQNDLDSDVSLKYIEEKNNYSCW